MESESPIQSGLPTPGSRWEDRFDVISELGNGAYGSVFKARHIMFDQFVAIKLLHADKLESEDALQRFQNEATLLNSFKHPNIVGFQSFGRTATGRSYMVIEFLPGRTLAELLDTGLTESRVREFFIDICKGLSYAHSQGIIHRDLKPSNIMIVTEPEGEVAKILDFGICKSTAAESQSLTRTGSLPLGTANYMSPEQCRTEKLGARSDIYSMGCMLYEALCGVPPMQADSELVVMSNHQSLVIDRVPAKQGISHEMERIILKCLQKDPSNRYSSTAELLADLEQSKTAVVGTPRTNNSKRHLIVAAVSIVVVLLCVPVGISVIQQNKLKPDSLVLNNYASRKLPERKNHHPIDRTKIPAGHEAAFWRNRAVPDVEGKTEVDLENIIDWINANYNVDKRNAEELAAAFLKASALRKEIKSDNHVPHATEIADRLVADLNQRSSANPGASRILWEELAVIQGFTRQYKEAVETWKNVLKTYDASEMDESPEKIAHIYDEIAINMIASDNFKGAISFFKKEIAVKTKIERFIDVATIQLRIGDLEKSGVDSEDAKRWILKASQTFLKCTDTSGKAPTDKEAKIAITLNSVEEFPATIAFVNQMRPRTEVKRDFDIDSVRIDDALVKAYAGVKNIKESLAAQNRIIEYLKKSDAGEDQHEHIAFLKSTIAYCQANGRADDAKKLESKLSEVSVLAKRKATDW